MVDKIEKKGESYTAVVVLVVVTLAVTMQSVVTGQAPITLERKIENYLTGGKQIKTEDNARNN